MSQLSIILRTIRIKNWIKNILILVPVCFSVLPITKNLVLGLLDIFLCISILASIVYIINDIFKVLFEFIINFFWFLNTCVR